MNLESIIHDCYQYLGLKKPYDIVIQNSIGKHRAEHIALHYSNGRIQKHHIKLAVAGLNRDLRNAETVIAHELIHAWQAEQRKKAIKYDIHGPYFQMKAYFLQHYLRGRGHNIGEIYVPGTDI